MARAVRVALAALLLAAGLAGVRADADRDVLVRKRTRIRQERIQLHGYMTHNASELGNWTLVHDDHAALAPRLAPLYAPAHGEYAFHPNVSGFFDGNFSAAAPPAGQNATSARGALDWAAPKTRLEMQLSERDVPHTNLSQVWGALMLTMPHNTSHARAAVELDVSGIFALHTGRMYLVGMPRTSPRVLDVRELLAMVPEEDAALKNATYTAVLRDIDDRLERIDAMLARGERHAPPDTAGLEASNCSMHLYGQLAPAGPRTFQDELTERERQLEHPTGVVTRRLPPLALQLLGVSDACALTLTSGTLDGITTHQFWADTRLYLCGMAAVVFVQLVLMMRMREQLDTESALAKVSGVTFFIQTMFDAHVCLAHLIIGMSLGSTQSLGMVRAPLTQFAVAFLAGLLFIAYEYPIVVAVLRQSMTAAPPPPPPAPAPADAPPAPPAAARGVWAERLAHARSTLTEATQDMPRVSVALVVTCIAFIVSIVKPFLLAMLLIPLLFSFWVPQIVHNYRVRASGVRAGTVVGMTVTRFYLPLCTSQAHTDLFHYRHNLLFFEPTPLVWVPLAWLVVQMLVLVGQDTLGPLFFVPAAWRDAEERWAWHPSPEALGALLRDAGDLETPLFGDARDVPLGDCPVCLAPNAWEADESDDEHGHLLGQAHWPRAWPWARDAPPRPNVMVTPCRHIFHTPCLEQWMRIKHVCPSCRLPLPPYEHAYSS
ncbi:hypothetical protein MOBT1_001809 [Malassezia obtusa]|uniref:RING-type E3 ubiquitin transferase n=1 Tax=Malassezia obtusa TaxID=76774 RepID=A0AAF0E0T7_9BASI|nr:hypothetical protein MOBT1_001809 [Malassezia obtusa]